MVRKGVLVCCMTSIRKFGELTLSLLLWSVLYGPSSFYEQSYTHIHAAKLITHATMGTVRIRHRSHHFATKSSQFVDGAGWQAQMAFTEFWHGYHDVQRTTPIALIAHDTCTFTLPEVLFMCHIHLHMHQLLLILTKCCWEKFSLSWFRLMWTLGSNLTITFFFLVCCLKNKGIGVEWRRTRKRETERQSQPQNSPI